MPSAVCLCAPTVDLTQLRWRWILRQVTHLQPQDVISRGHGRRIRVLFRSHRRHPQCLLPRQLSCYSPGLWSVPPSVGNPSRSHTTSSKTNFRNNRKSSRRGFSSRVKGLTCQNKRNWLKVNTPSTCFTLLWDLRPEGTKPRKRGALRERLLQVTSLGQVSTPPFPPLPSCPEFPRLPSQVQGFRMGGLICVTSSPNISRSQSISANSLPPGSVHPVPGFPGCAVLFLGFSSPTSEPLPDVG